MLDRIDRTGQPGSAVVATVLLVFGRGVQATGGTHALTAASIARVRAAVDYVRTHAEVFARAADQGPPPRVVFSGGWAEASEGAVAPPSGCREGDLMLDHAHAAGLDRYAQLHAESRSRSTLENFLHTVGDGLLAGRVFAAGRPLGLVTHDWHLPRVRFLAGKVLGLRGAALLGVTVPEPDEAAVGWRSERVLHLATRLGFVGVRDPERLLRRERRMVASVRWAERWARPGG